MPTSVARDIAFFRYREAFHLSYEQAMAEPYEEVQRAFVIWSQDAKRDKLRAAQQQTQ